MKIDEHAFRSTNTLDKNVKFNFQLINMIYSLINLQKQIMMTIVMNYSVSAVNEAVSTMNEAVSAVSETVSA